MILTTGPFISAREVSYVLDAARNGWNRQVDTHGLRPCNLPFGLLNGYIKWFEAAPANYVRTKYALST